MEAKFLKDALFAGMTANAFKLGTVLSIGWFWMRPAGCHTVYRGQDGAFDYDVVQAVMNLGDTQASIANQFLPTETSWHYIRRQASGCGLESDDSPTCVVYIASDGYMAGEIPNTPLQLTAQGLVGGKIKLRWRYAKIDQEVPPTEFRIYVDSGSGFDFDSPAGTVPYLRGGPKAGEFEWISDALTHGELYCFCVRSCRVLAPAWHSPIHHDDIGGDWTNEANAYDDDDETKALGAPSGDFIELLTDKRIECSKVRIHIEPGGPSSGINFDLDVYCNGSWQGLWSGDYTGDWTTYIEFAVGSTETITKARVKNLKPLLDAALHEFDFFGSEVCESRNTDYASAVADSVGPAAITGLRATWEEK